MSDESALPRWVDVGDDRQLLFDDFFFERQDNLTFTLHPPRPGEVVLRADRPWEGGCLHYSCVLLDQGRYRMWYRADEGEHQWTCYAESRDGINWEKPSLGIVQWHGSTDNNILFPVEDATGANPSVIMDDGAIDPGERYKMIVRSGRIDGYVSPDGLRWRFKGTILDSGPVDSHNVLLRDDERRYVVYARDLPESAGRRRSVRRGESEDFTDWSDFALVLTPDEEDPPDLNIYTNAAVKYGRSPRSYFMFPMVLYTGRANPEAPHPGLSDVQFASSRDGVHWNRSFRRPFLSPGPDPESWVDRNPIMGIGVVPTGPREISMYFSDFLRSSRTCLRRATLRMDGFVSVDGPYRGWGEFTTVPLLFRGATLELNCRTGGGGSIAAELLEASGTPIPGFEMADCREMQGDTISGKVEWSGGDLVQLRGRPLRLRVRMRDSELYAFRFAPA